MSQNYRPRHEVGYQGFSYSIFGKVLLRLGLWKRFFCAKGVHLWDEVFSGYERHLLVCDACGVEVHISKIIYWEEKILTRRKKEK